MYSYKEKLVFNDHLGSSTDLCYIQNCVITKHVMKRFRFIQSFQNIFKQSKQTKNKGFIIYSDIIHYLGAIVRLCR